MVPLGSLLRCSLRNVSYTETVYHVFVCFFVFLFVFKREREKERPWSWAGGELVKGTPDQNVLYEKYFFNKNYYYYYFFKETSVSEEVGTTLASYRIKIKKIPPGQNKQMNKQKIHTNNSEEKTWSSSLGLNQPLFCKCQSLEAVPTPRLLSPPGSLVHSRFAAGSLFDPLPLTNTCGSFWLFCWLRYFHSAVAVTCSSEEWGKHGI